MTAIDYATLRAHAWRDVAVGLAGGILAFAAAGQLASLAVGVRSRAILAVVLILALALGILAVTVARFYPRVGLTTGTSVLALAVLGLTMSNSLTPTRPAVVFQVGEFVHFAGQQVLVYALAGGILAASVQVSRRGH